MSCIEVRTQDELNTARKKDNACIHIVGDGYFEIGGSATVRASDSATVEAWGSAQIRAKGQCTINASKFVAVTIHGVRTRVTGGVQIQLPEITTAEEWCDFYGLNVTDGIVVLYKALNAEYRSTRDTSFQYIPGTTPEAKDWDDGKEECGGGLHFSPRPMAALRFNNAPKHFVACPVRVDEIVVHKNALYPDKVKAPRVAEPCWEVDIDSNRIEANR